MELLSRMRHHHVISINKEFRIHIFFIKTKQNKKLLLKGLLTGTRCSEATLLKKRLWRRCFPVNFAKFLRTPILQNTSGGRF